MAKTQTAQRNRTLRYLTVFNATSTIDRHIIAIALPAIGAEFALNDIQLGILSGIAFSLIFAVAVVPLGLLTVFLDRRHVIAVSIFLWSLMTVLSGFAINFWTLFLTRVGIGIAEAGGLPAAHRTLSNQPGERLRDFSVFNAGGSAGIALALVGGGILIQLYGWRTAMIVAGIPGLIIAFFAHRAIHQQPATTDAIPHNRSDLPKEAAKLIFHNPAKRLVFIGVLCTSIISFGMLAWIPSYLMRVHDLPAQQVGIFLATSLGVLGFIGTIWGGKVVDRFARSNPAWVVWFPLVLLLIGKPLILLAMLTESAQFALFLLVFPFMFGTLHFVTSLAILHEGIDERPRHIVSAIVLMGGNLIGYSLGPLIVGVASWSMQDTVSDDRGLGYAIIVLQAFSIIGIIAYWRAGFAYRVHAQTAGNTLSTASSD